MILIPWSIFLFVFIVLIKVICFFLAEHKKRGAHMARNNEIRNRYGKFNDDEVDEGTEAVIGHYFKIMERVKFRTVASESADNAGDKSNDEFAYMANQKQCRLCL